MIAISGHGEFIQSTYAGKREAKNLNAADGPDGQAPSA